MQNINVNIVPDNFPQTIRYSQGDIGRQFKINVADFDIPVGATVKIQATKPSGFGFSVAGVVSDNSVTFTTTEEMTDEAGRFQAELQITAGGDVIGTANFLMIGERNPHPEGTTDGSQGTIIPELTLLVERVEKAASDVLDMEVVATTLPAGSQATYSYDEDLNKATFGIPEGQAGAGAAGVVASAYSAAKTYKVGDYVLYNSNLYRCTTAITTAEAWTAAHWTQVVLADDVTDLKSDLNSVTEVNSNNLFDIRQFKNRTGITLNGNEITGKLNVIDDYNLEIAGGFKENTRYTIGLTAKESVDPSSTAWGLAVWARYSDNTLAEVFSLKRNTLTYTRKSGTTQEGKTVTSLVISYNNGGSDVWNVKDIQVEEGTTATAYSEFQLTAVDEIARNEIANLPYDLYPTGTTANRVPAIRSILAEKGCCKLAPGDYYFGALNLNDYDSIEGCGENTRIIVNAKDGEHNYAILARKGCKISNLQIIGDTNDLTPSAVGTFDGILVQGLGNDGTQKFKIDIHNVTIKNCDGAGIHFKGTGYGMEGGCHISDSFISQCGIGIHLDQYAEFHRITGVSVNACYYGTLNNGGNNVFVNCDFSGNTKGIVMDNSSETMSNNSHGSFVGCTINHSDNNNGTAIEMIKMWSGEVFSALQLFYGGIVLTDCNYVQFANINGGTFTPITISGGGLIVFSDCIFRSGNDVNFSATNNNKVKFNNCYLRDGTDFDPTV